MTPDERTKHSQEALLAFGGRVKDLALWNGAWIGLVAIKSNANWQLYLLRTHLTAPGLALPDVIDATTPNVLVRAFRIEAIENVWPLLAGVVLGDLSELNKLAGVTLELPVGKNPATWSATTTTSASSYHRVEVGLSCGFSLAFYEVFGHQFFERLAPQLQGHEPPYASLQQIATSMRFSSPGNFDSSQASPKYEITAELPLGPVKAHYSAAQKGIEVTFPAGKEVPLARVSVSIVGGALREKRAGTEFTSAPTEVDPVFRTTPIFAF